MNIGTYVNVVRSGRVTTATVQINGYIGVGGSIRHEDDEPYDEIGNNLAIGRALIDLGKKMSRDAHKASNRKVNK